MPQRDFAAETSELFERALTRERESTDPAGAFSAVCVRLGKGLARWIGADGWDALVDRARNEAGGAASNPSPQDDLVTLQLMATILARLIGLDLTLRLLEQACELPDGSQRGGK